LITVNYFAGCVVIASGFLSALIPSIGFALPGNLKEWMFLFFLGICGFTSQCLGAAGLMYESGSSRATNMIYSQMLFALIMDQLVFGHSPELLSLIGSSLILGSAIVVAFRKTNLKQTTNRDEALDIIDEEIGLMSGVDPAEEVSETISMREMSPRPEDDRR
jgi:drug/metabolite transporter (DMT)-like permease